MQDSNGSNEPAVPTKDENMLEQLNNCNISSSFSEVSNRKYGMPSARYYAVHNCSFALALCDERRKTRE